MTHLLDTNIVLLHLGGRLGERLPGGVHGVSVITEIEALSWPGLDDASERRICEFLETVRVIELDRAAAEFGDRDPTGSLPQDSRRDHRRNRESDAAETGDQRRAAASVGSSRT